MTDQKKTPGGGNREGAKKFRHPQRTNSLTCPQDAAQDFKTALDKAGLSTKESVTPDGKLHRFQVEGDKPGSKNGAYVLYGDGLPAGWFGCWKRQISQNWCAKSDRQMSAAERTEFSRRMIEARKAREAEEQARRNAARDKAFAIWKAALPAPDTHPYLVKKGVGNHGLRLYKTSLVVPMRDSAGNLHSLQFIDGEGNKRFLSGGRKRGCYFAVGVPTESPQRKHLYCGRVCHRCQHIRIHGPSCGRSIRCREP